VHLSAAMIPPQSALDELAAPPLLTRLVETLGSYTGPEWWMTHLSVLRRTWVKPGVVARPFEVIDEVVFEG